MNQSIIFFITQNDYTGASKVALEYIKALQDERYFVYVVIVERNKNLSSTLDNILQISKIRYSLIRPKNIDRDFFKSLCEIIGNLFFLKNIILVSVNQGSMIITSLLCSILKFKSICLVQNTRTFSSRFRFFKEIKKILYKSLSKKYDLCINVSESLFEENIKKSYFVNVDSIVIPNGIGEAVGFITNNFREVKRKSSGDKKVIKFEIVFIGRIAKQKGLIDLVSAIKTLNLKSDLVRVRLFGSISSEEKEYFSTLQRMISENNLNDLIFFEGWCDDISAALLGADLFVQPSRWEGPPLTISVLEAMSVGVTCVISDCSGLPTGLTVTEDIFVFPASDVAKLASVIGRCINMSPQSLKAVGISGQRSIKKLYSIKSMRKEFISAIKRFKN